MTKSACDDCVTKNCMWRAPTGGPHPPIFCCPQYTEKPITNADRIRAMTDEELADAFNDIFYGFSDVPGGCGMCDSDSIQNCRVCWLDWLKREVEE